MKRLLLGLVGLLCAVGCTREERYTKVVADIQPKTAMVQVDGIAKVVVGLTMHADSKGHLALDVITATAPVTYLGSAVFVSPVGGLLTCAHLFDMLEVDTVTVTTSTGIRLAARILSVDEDHDLALLKVAGTHAYAKLASVPLRLGQEVFAVGNPRGLDFSTSHGIVSHIDRDLELGYFFTQTDAPINPGNSGGPLYDVDGNLVGIVARGARDNDGLGFAISPAVIADFLAQFRGL